MSDLPAVRTAPTPSFDEAQLVNAILSGFEQARQRRYNFETQWDEAARLCWPEYANTFFFGYDQMPGQKKTQQQLDSQAAIASHRFSAIVDSLMTPMGAIWSRLKHPDKYLMKQRGVKDYYDEFSECVWGHRYAATANFQGQNQQNYQSLGVFGNMNMYIDELDPHTALGQRGLRYSMVAPGHMYYVQNHQGQITSFYRTMRWTAKQIYETWPDRFPETLRPALERQSQTLYWIVQYVAPRTDWLPWVVTEKGKRWVSYYVSFDGYSLLEEKGYRTYPMAHGRYMIAPDEDYGRGPAQMVLPTLKTKNIEKGTFLTQGHRAGNPIYLGPEEGLGDPELIPGKYNPGFVVDGKPQIHMLPTGKIDITKEMMDEEAMVIDDAFLVTLFKFALKMEDMPNLSTRQVVEHIEQKGILLAPMIGRQMTEYLGTMIPREIDVLAAQGLLPPVHPAVVEYGASQYDVEFDNPLTRMMASGEVAGFMQAVEMTKEVAQSSGDDTVWDVYDFPTAIPEIATRRGFPVRWLSDEKKLAEKRQMRAERIKREQDAKEMPARAAIIKANAIAAKAQAGQNIGGTLSGTPEGGMPEIPSNRGQPGRPGMPGQPGGF